MVKVNIEKNSGGYELKTVTFENGRTVEITGWGVNISMLNKMIVKHLLWRGYIDMNYELLINCYE